MKKILSLLTLALGLSVFTACNDEEVPANGYIAPTEDGSSTIVLKGYENTNTGFSVLQPANFTSPFYIKDKKLYGEKYNFILTTDTNLKEMNTVPEDGDWKSSISIYAGACYWARHASSVYRYIKLRVAYIEGNNVGIEYVVSSTTTVLPNSNSNLGYTNQAAWELEIPHLDDSNFFAAHYTSFEGNTYMNMALEWNAGLRHANWVAYSFDKNTARSIVSRGSNWAWDPEIPTSQGVVEEEDHKSDGYDKGHLCASADRLYSTEANDQTFYYSNMSPMMHNFNSGFWSSIEARVRVWGQQTKEGTFDKVYVVKGGTLNNLLKNMTGPNKGNDGIVPTTDANGLTIHGLAVPAYYFAAVLAEKNGVYQAIGFLVEHDDNLTTTPSEALIKSRVIGIDDLESFTGIDFFCNLEDEIENTVEATVDQSLWIW